LLEVGRIFVLMWCHMVQAEMKTFERFDPEYLRLQYERKLEELEEEKRSLQVKFCISFVTQSVGLFLHHHYNLAKHSVANSIVCLFMS
jgi:hypothetical protein